MTGFVQAPFESPDEEKADWIVVSDPRATADANRTSESPYDERLQRMRKRRGEDSQGRVLKEDMP